MPNSNEPRPRHHSVTSPQHLRGEPVAHVHRSACRCPDCVTIAKEAQGLKVVIRELEYGRRTLTAVCLLATSFIVAEAADVRVRNGTEFREAIAKAVPGTRVLLAPGVYTGGLYFSTVRGETNRPVHIGATDAANPPVIDASEGGLQFSHRASWCWTI